MRIPAVLALVALTACSSNIETGDSAAANLIGGQAAGAKYGAVGALTEDGPVFCTATLVAPGWIITAQHCIEGGSEGEPEPRDPAKTSFVLGADASKPTRSVHLRKWWPMPDFPHPENTTIASDVMLAELAEPVTDVTPIPLSTGTLDDAALGAELQVVGFGVQSVNGFEPPGGKREVGAMKLEAARGNAFAKRFGDRAGFDAFFATLDPDAAADGQDDRLYASADLHEGYEVLARGEAAETCYSDSGGPLLRTERGRLTVSGVVSKGFPGYASSCLHLGTIFAVFGPETRPFLQARLTRP